MALCFFGDFTVFFGTSLKKTGQLQTFHKQALIYFLFKKHYLTAKKI